MSEAQRNETPPAWLNDSFIEYALKKGFKDEDLKVLNTEIKMATSAGDHYGSQMFRINLTIKTKTLNNDNRDGKTFSIIVKTIPPGLLGEEMKKLSIFAKEDEAFLKALPAIEVLLKKAYPKHEKLWAECYYQEGSPRSVLVLEDLRRSNYVMGNRFEGLDMEHSFLVLESLAKFHAASLVARKKQPECFEAFESTFWNETNSNAIQFSLKTPFKVLSKEVENWTGFERKDFFAKKLQEMEETVLEKVFKIWQRDDTRLSVVLHGDPWLNNFMFRYDPTGKINGIKFVDFQLMNLNTPVLDLQYFIFTSVRPDLKFDFFDAFLKKYHEVFEDTLKRLEYSLEVPFGLEELQKDFEDKFFWGFTVLCTIFPLFLVPIDEVFHPDEILTAKENSKFENIFRRKNLRKVLERGFLFFEEKGIL